MANQSVIIGGKEIPLVVMKSDCNIASRQQGGKYYRPPLVPPFDFSSMWEEVVSQPRWVNDSAVDIRNPVMTKRDAIRSVGGGRFGDDAFTYTNGQSLQVGSAPFNLLTDFTAEGHIWFDSLSRSNQYIFDCGNNGFTFRWYGGAIVVNHGVTITTTFVPNVSQWYHFAVVRKNGVVSIYMEGQRIGQGSYSAQINQASFTWGNHGNGGAYSILGKISQPRLSLFARYDGPTIDVPTAPFSYGTFDADYDPFWDRVQAYVHVNGSSVVDAKGANSVEVVGSPQVDTVNKRFGRNTIQFNGDGSFIRLPNTGGKWNFGTDDWAIEVDVMPTATLSNVWRTIVDRRSTAQSGGFRIGLTGMRPTAYYSTGTGGWSAAIGNTAGSELQIGLWATLALVRAGSEIRLYVNGEMLGTTTGIGASALTTVDLPITIGASSDGTNPITLLVGQTRITRYAPRYSAPFTPMLTKSWGTRLPNSSELAVTDRDSLHYATSIQLPFNEHMREVRNNLMPTVAGTVVIDNTILLRGRPSMGMVTTGNNGLSYAVSRGGLLSGADFTIEADIQTNYTAATPTLPIASQWSSSPTTGMWMFGVRNSKLYFWYNGTQGVVSSVDVADNQPHHVAAVRKNGVITLYVDGQAVGSEAISTIFNTTVAMQIGQNPQAAPAGTFKLNIANLYLTNGKARYDGNFAVPGLRSQSSIAA